MMEPLQAPRLDYVSVPPYRVTFEWLNGRLETRELADLPHAIFAFWDSIDAYGPFGEDRAPHRRVVVDVRGVTILGALDKVPSEDPVVASKEVIDLQGQLGCNPIDLIELELEILWRLETKA